MKIALIGYGKMGKAIEKIAHERGHETGLIIDQDNTNDLTAENLRGCDVAIEFSTPEFAENNIKACLEAGIPVVSGTTGWLDRLGDVKNLCESRNGAMVYASNFSIGVNLFFEVNKHLANLMGDHPQYNVHIEEIHHTQKKDSPSGTAITLAEQIIESSVKKNKWVNSSTDRPQELYILSQRIDPAAGTHRVVYSSPVDDLEIIHTAHNREGFATGAVQAAEFIIGKKGIFGMKEVLGLK